MQHTVVIIGAGAGGYFAALRLAALRPDLRILLLEKSAQPLGKVKISGGGRCNVTHACFEPRQLVQYYPRGSKELLGPFHRFQPADVFEWFEKRMVPLKTEDDGRVFPVSDSSQTIIDCFEAERERLGIALWTQAGVQSMEPTENGWNILLNNGNTEHAHAVIVAAGSSPQMAALLEQLGLNMVPAVPSLFTFNIKDPRIDGMAGLSAPHAEVHIEGTDHETEGPLLVTHWGMSGPGILKLSAWAARDLARANYEFTIRINWDARYDKDSALDFLKEWKQEHARAQVKSLTAVRVPHRLWMALMQERPQVADMRWADVSAKNLEWISEAICRSYFSVKGKSTFKDEFVTAGGVDLKEVDMRSMQAKKFAGLFFAGEVMNIDAVTGGFNFQAAWTTGWIAAEGIAEYLSKKP